MKKTIYKEGLDPFEVTSDEQLQYHLNQGWSLDKVAAPQHGVVAPPTPSIVGNDGSAELKRRIDELEGMLADMGSDDPDPRIKELEEIVAAKDQQILDMQSDFEEMTSQLNQTIKELTEKAAGQPAAPVAKPAAARSRSKVPAPPAAQ